MLDVYTWCGTTHIANNVLAKELNNFYCVEVKECKCSFINTHSHSVAAM